MSESERSRKNEAHLLVNEAHRPVKEGERRVNEIGHISLYTIILSLLLSLISRACVRTPVCTCARVCACDRGEGRRKAIGTSPPTLSPRDASGNSRTVCFRINDDAVRPSRPVSREVGFNRLSPT